MKILRLKLTNFIGIKDGLGENEIEIFFPDNDLIFTGIFGKNGSGKSTILSQLTPFKDSFDGKKKLVIDDAIGVKEIDYSHNGSIYKIKHVYDKKVSCFIEKDGEELNPNGGVRTFEDIVEIELGATKDYQMIGNLGASSSETFVNLKSSDRKEFISRRVADVAKYLDAFEEASNKFKVVSDTVKTIAKNLQNYGDYDILKIQVDTAKKKHEELYNEFIESSKELAVLSSEITRLNEELESIDYIGAKDKLSESTNVLNTSIAKFKKLLSLYDENKYVSDYALLNNFEVKLNRMNQELAALNAEVTTLNEQLVNTTNNKIKLKYQLDGIIKNPSISSTQLEVEINNLTEELNKAKTELDNSPLKNYINSGDISTVSVNLSKYETFMKFILDNFTQLNSASIQPELSNIELFFKNNCPEILKNQILHTRETIENTQKLKINKEILLGSKMVNLNKIDILNSRPKSCKDDTCPFISDALQYANLPKELSEIETDIDALAKTLEELEITAEHIDNTKDLFKLTRINFTQLSATINYIYKYQSDKYGNVVQLLKKSLNELNNIYSSTKTEVEYFVKNYNICATCEAKLQKLSSDLTSLKNSEDIINYYNKEIINSENESQKIASLIDNKRNSASELNKNILDVSAYINLLKEFNSCSNNMTTIQTEIDAMNKIISEYDSKSSIRMEKMNRYNVLNQLLTNNKNETTTLAEQIKNNEIILSKIEELNKQQIEVADKYSKLKLVKDALDPRFGIPLIFIQSYLGKTEIIANELLNIAFNGQFEIHFESNAKDFFIRVRTEDSVKPDITDASTGEIALTAISLSLALIEQSLSGYNILVLDEIDGNLDEDNRELFISILDSQIKKLGIEQVFIISHNNAFDNVPMNLILLKGKDYLKENEAFMENKNIIFEVE